jgi:hypothetical protein
MRHGLCFIRDRPFISQEAPPSMSKLTQAGTRTESAVLCYLPVSLHRRAEAGKLRLQAAGRAYELDEGSLCATVFGVPRGGVPLQVQLQFDAHEAVQLEGRLVRSQPFRAGWHHVVVEFDRGSAVALEQIATHLELMRLSRQGLVERLASHQPVAS